MHKIARMEDGEYRIVRKPKKRMPIVSRGAVRDYEEAEDNGEEDPMIAEEIEQEKPDKTEKGTVEFPLSYSPDANCQILTGVCVIQVQRRSTTAGGESSATA